nr:cobalamin-binding protein [Sporosalibacterium faouarense]
MEIEDGFGNKVTLDGKPWRIISLAPNHTEILFKLGLGNRIVGVDSYSDYPAEAKEIEKVGDSETINIEKIIELDPDLVIQYGPGAEDVNKSLRDAGITLLSYEPESIDDVINLITELGKITDTMRTAKMETVVMQSKLEYITQVVEDAEKTKVFYEVWNDPLMTAGPGTFLNELITLAGGENIAADAEEGYPLFDTEQLIEKNPDVYIATKDSDKEEIINRPGYDEINAINNDRIYLLEPNIISRPGPRIVDGLELMAKTLHPELFE